jgi:glycosyltransferase involved in cell wall biosynthesis
MSTAIQRLVSDAELRNDLIEKGLERVKRFSWKTMAQEYLALYNRVYNQNYQKK